MAFLYLLNGISLLCPTNYNKIMQRYEVMCKSLEPFLYTLLLRSQTLVIFLKWSSSIALLGFLKVLQGFSLDIGLLLTYFQSSPCTWPFSEKCCLFVKLLHTDLWITQASQRQFLKRRTSVYTHDRQLSKEPVLNWSKLLHLQQMNSMWKPCPWGVGKKSSKDPTPDPRDASGHVVDHLLCTEAFSAQAWLSISLKRPSFAKWHTNWTKNQWKLHFQILLCTNFDSPYNTTGKQLIGNDFVFQRDNDPKCSKITLA